VAVLPLAAGALVWATVHRRRAGLGLAILSARGTFLVAYAVTNGLLLAITEVASTGHRLTPGTTAASWAGAVVVLAAVAARTGAIEPGRWRRCVADGWRGAAAAERVAVVVAVAFGSALAAAALLYRPRTADSMMYHLTRVEHWVQNRTIAPFATHMIAQVDMAPLHEYGLTHLHLLTGSDRFDGLLQLLAYVVVVAGVSELARLLGGSRRAQVLASMVALTLPSAVLEGSSTQNDLFAAANALTLVLVVASWDTSGGVPYLPRAALVGLTGATAFLSKGTVLPTIGPAVLGLALVWAVREVRAAGTRRAAVRLAASAGVALAVALLAAGPFAARNVALFGSVNGSDEAGLLIEEPTLAATAANTIRAVGSNFRIGDGESGAEHQLSEVALRAAQWAFDLTGVEPDDTRYLLGGESDVFERRDYGIYQRYAEYGANPWHVLLLAAAGPALVVQAWRRRRDWSGPVLAAGLAAGLVAFSGLVRWQIFGVRFQLAMLVVACALIALVLAPFGPALGAVVVALLVVASVPMLVDNAERPLVDPTYDDADTYLEHYLPDDTAASTSAADQDTTAAAMVASGCDRFGLANWIPFEYPLWVALDHHGWSGDLQAVGVTNDSADAAGPFEPCGLVGMFPIDGDLAGAGERHRFGALELVLLDA
jgi:hypothetical protein